MENKFDETGFEFGNQVANQTKSNNYHSLTKEQIHQLKTWYLIERGLYSAF
jgi:hypothetical protein